MPVNTVEINKLAKNCIEPEPAHCVGACPFNMDLRAFSGAVAEGDFGKARKIFEEQVFLPHIIAEICDERCKSECLRKDLGGSVEAHILEKTVMRLTEKPEVPETSQIIPKRQRLAVVGSGLSGLYATATLLYKLYSVSVFDMEKEPGGRLRARPGLAEAIAKDIQDLPAAQFMYGIEVGKEVSLQDLAKEFDAVIVCWGAERGRAEFGPHDSLTLQVEKSNIFLAGSVLGPEVAASPSLTAESGRRAAISAERMFQKVALTGNRGKEGVFTSRLYTNTSEIAPLATALDTAKSDVCAPEEARAEAARCIQCHCLECKRRCVFLQHYDVYSGGAIRPVIKNVNITRQWGHRYATPFIVSCAICGLCGKVCPTDIDMGYVNQSARDAMWENTYLPPAMHNFPLRDMEDSLDAAHLVRHQPGHETSRYALFPGCQLPASMPATTKALYKHLTERLEGGVGMLMGCCGLPARWASRLEREPEIRDLLRKDWESLGKPELLVCCPGCYKQCAEHIPDIPIRFIAEVLPDLLPEPTAAEPYAFHDPCMSRHYQAVQDSGRTLAARVGAAVEELPVNRDDTVCCSFGGLQYHANREMSAETVSSRIGQSPLAYLTSCSNCRDFFRFGGKDCVHLLELAFGREEEKGMSSYACMDFTKRRHQRRQLVAELKQELWGEPSPAEETHLEFVFPDELYEKLNRKDMLVQDAVELITDAETTGKRIISGDTGWYVASRHDGLVTYWAEYSVEDGRILVRNAYTHRMQILYDTIRDK